MRDSKDELLFGIFVTAIEGGTGYWAQVEKYVWDVPDNSYYAIMWEFDEMTGKREGEPYRLDRNVIIKGIHNAVEAWSSRGSDYQSNAIRGLFCGAEDVDYDADTADIIVQFGLLGELVYG